MKKFSPLAADAEKVEHQTQELIISVAELQRRFNSQFRQVGCAKIGALIGKKKNGTVSHVKKMGLGTSGLIHWKLFNPQISLNPLTKSGSPLLVTSAPLLLENLQENVCTLQQDLPKTFPLTPRPITRKKKQHKPAKQKSL